MMSEKELINYNLENKNPLYSLFERINIKK